MPEYLHPGVYVEEVDAGPKPIEGVSTSTAGAVGATERGPTTGKPVLCTSFADFQRTFGDFLPVPDAPLLNQWNLNQVEGGRWWLFPLAVKGFFDNGGQRLYVKRVFARPNPTAGTGAVASSETLGQGLTAAVAADVNVGATQVRLAHTIGIQNGTTLDFFGSGTALMPGSPYTVASYDGAGTVTLTAALQADLRAGRDLAVIAARSASPVPNTARTMTFTAKSLGEWGDSVSVRVRPMVGGTHALLADPATGGLAVTTHLSADATNTNTLQVDDTTGFTTGDHARILGREFTLTVVDGTHFTVAPAVGATVTWTSGTSIARLRPAGSGTSMRLVNASQLYDSAVLEFDNGTQKEVVVVDVGGVVGNVVSFTPALANVYNDGHKARVVEMEVATRYRAADGRIVAQEIMPNLRLHNDTNTSFVETAVGLQSSLVDALTLPGAGYSDSNLTLFPTSPGAEWVDLTGGDDALADLTVDDFVGIDGGSGNRTGIQALEDIEEISLVAAPGMWSSTVNSSIIQHCEQLRYRFAVIDARDGLPIQGIRDFRDSYDTKYAALYYPWIEVRDPSVHRNVIAPPSLHMLGLYARVDVNRGVHKAPANEVIGAITRISQDVNQREQDMLNPKGINALRFFPGRGNRVWGARTLSSDGSWKYINVRRIFIYVEASIDRGTQWVVFEPNDEPLWARVRATITNFLTSTWRSGMLQGSTPEEAFFVKVDRTTMTQDDIDNGRLICLIGIAPVKPAEFVIFRIQQKTLELNPS
ncbi:MAG TPA: phage tail sheath subtilisin-like domain-containing protein [Kofleriaceae bacterium]|jgi:phage tail sheath protein FI